ncbi:MAG: crossover junction endodeoxyribonuclease RuvC [Actinomycetaceae bacterium]|nr:crossover junction endodeoxyribonuclease RuvC [Actinomycetaceae bacterium]MDY6083267.1 crossover junction endodeoxyribonuclease RuvC [Actinomycetaceae bacterium]
MRILGVDPGLTRCGLGTIEASPTRQVTLVDMRVARSSPTMAPHKRLLMIADELEEVITTFKPQVIAVERVFAQANVRSVTGTAQVAGIVMLAAARHDLPLGLHTPSEVKAAVTGSGRADKAQVQKMVQRILGMETLPRPADAADSLAIAITQAWRGGAQSLSAQPDRTQHGGADTLPRATGSDLTPAQKLWASAERLSSRHGAVAPGYHKHERNEP